MKALMIEMTEHRDQSSDGATELRKHTFDEDFGAESITVTSVMQNSFPANQAPSAGATEPPTGAEESLAPDGLLDNLIPDEMVHFDPLNNPFPDFEFDIPWDLDLDTRAVLQLESQCPSPPPTNTSSTNTMQAHKVAFRNPPHGHAAFKRSLWLWEPEQEDYVRQEKEGLHIDEQSISQSHVFNKPMDNPLRNLTLNAHQRDRVLSMAMAQNKDSMRVPTFPTLELLNYLLQAHFAHDHYQLESWIHAPSFDPETAMPELLAAVISNGATSISIPAMWKFGLALQEVARRGFEASNVSTRDLKALQAFMICLDVGMWSGFKRKMEIAESFCKTILTMLRRAGMFSTSNDWPSIHLLESDPAEVVETKWQEFITQESYKRLILHVFTFDAQTSISLQTNPLITYNELSFRLPASRDLWRAPTADSWRQIYLSKKNNHRPIPRISEIMHDLNVLDELQEHIDVDLCRSVLLHGFWGQIHAYREGVRFYTGTHRLWLRSQHQELYQDLSGFSTVIHTTGSREHKTHLSLILDLFLMILHVSPDELQNFAGKAGEQEARRASAKLERWAGTAEARYAVWYAGQVFLSARRLTPASLRGFSAVAVYLASLTLWVYGLLRRPTTPPHTGERDDDHTVHAQAAGSHEAAHSRRGSAPAVDGAAKYVLLDGEEARDTKAFLHLDRGIPALTTSGGAVEPLSNPSMTLSIARGIFRENFPVRSEPLPPLVESLGNLLRDL
ncbi:hypothetical protein VMCG_07036 [Cytospora schulzeri]|uniref:Xylanolytic transcriptional activator regulatory domain-containing protein n=1 Tax=Cytospora schulzeri TaxID=448051 RepID=A0A423W3Z0_9PEZI|nr:hypothetical protein VMCG_07036 [Valsa malicola]